MNGPPADVEAERIDHGVLDADDLPPAAGRLP
jgi:hypothetical protein